MSPSLSRRYQVFVSSTYEDLIEERRHVIQALLETRCIPAGMELFPASTEAKWTLIKRLIDDCDYFIVIIAGMYGSSPVPNGPSYTEMEFDYAVSRGMQPIGFFHSDIGALPSSRVERADASRQKLETFAKKVTEGMCARWRSPAELGSAVKSAMINAFDHDPKPGWLKAKSLPNAAELSEIRVRAAAGEGGILKEEMLNIQLVESSQQLRGENALPEVHFETSLKDTFAAITSKLERPKPAGALHKMFLRRMAPELARIQLTRKEGGTPIRWVVQKDFFERILKTFLAKGLLRQVQPPRHLLSRTSLYWQLTSSGLRERARLEALL